MREDHHGAQTHQPLRPWHRPGRIRRIRMAPLWEGVGTVPAVIINGQSHCFPDGTTILTACRQLGIEIPTLCHDDRLKPCGACRLCGVAIKGWNRHATACNTFLMERREMETHSSAIEDVRRTLLDLLADDYPAEAVQQSPGKTFHRWLRHYRIPVGIDGKRLNSRTSRRRD